MAKTFAKQRISVSPEEFNSVVVLSGLEGATQTFKRGAPLTITAGLLVAAASPVAAATLAGFAEEDAHNDAGGITRIQFAPAKPGMHIYANFLGAAGIDNVFAQADLGVAFDIELDADGHPDGGEIYFVLDAAGTANAALMVADKSDVQPADTLGSRAEVGDTNVRVLFRIVDAAIQV